MNMNEKKKTKWKLAQCACIALLAGILPWNLQSVRAEEGEKTRAQTVSVQNLNCMSDNNMFLGVDNPERLNDATSQWNGSYLRFGSYMQGGSNEKTDVRWRVLDCMSDSMSSSASTQKEGSYLLLSDQILDCVKFNENQEKNAGKNEWGTSNIKKWLNSETFDGGYTSGGFLQTAFSAVEQEALQVTVQAEGDALQYLNSPGITGEKIFLLSARDMQNSAYGFWPSGDTAKDNQSTRLGVTEYAQKQGVRQENGYGYWWLRSKANYSDRIAGIVDYDGWLFDDNVTDGVIGVAPAIHINPEKIVYVTADGMTKGDFGLVGTAKSETDTWDVTLMGSQDKMDVSLAGEKRAKVKSFYNHSGEMQIDLQSEKSASEVLNSATQVSALVKDELGNVQYYGKISGDTNAKNFMIHMPADVPDGLYTIYVYAEQITAQGCDIASQPDEVDPIYLIIQNHSDTEGETPANQKYHLLVNDKEQGSYEAGTPVRISADEASEGYQFVEWKSENGNVSLNNPFSASTTFVMPAHNVVLNASYQVQNYTITYDLNGGKLPQKNPVTYNIETETFQLNNPMRDGYSFDGWSGKVGDTAISTLPQTNVQIAKGSTGNRSYVANWKKISDKNNVTVTMLQSVGGKAECNVTEGAPGTKIVVMAHPNDGYEFSNLTVVQGDATVVKTADEIRMVTLGNENVVLCPIFTKIGDVSPVDEKKYTVTYRKNTSASVSGLPKDTKGYKDGKEAIVLSAPQSTSQFFVGWSASADGQRGQLLQPGDKLIMYRNVVLYAQWTKSYTTSNFKFSVNGKNTVTCTGTANKSATNITIPNSIKYNGVTYKVTEVASNAFANNTKLTSVTLGDNIKTIQSKAFYQCTKLKNVSVGKNLTTIKKQAFGKNQSGFTLKIASKKLSSVKGAQNQNTKNFCVKVPSSKKTKYKKLFQDTLKSKDAKIKNN